MSEKNEFNVGDLVRHRFINFGYGIIIEKRESINFGDFMHSYVIHFPESDVKRLLYSSEINKYVSEEGHSER